jgi:hypothetical protein
MSTDSGFLANWSDVAEENETDYLHWLTREHVQERLGIPGFLGVRVFRARIPGVKRYFILYDLADSGVVGSPDYLARLNDPTRWSRRIMPTLGNFARGGGRRSARIGRGAGALVAPLLVSSNRLADALRRAPDIAEADRIAAVQVLAVDRNASEIRTDEKARRTGDRSFDGLLLIEALDEAGLARAIDGLAAELGCERPDTYGQVFALRADELP